MPTIQIIWQSIVLFIAAILAGALNSVAGGGSFISTPALLATQVPILNANTTNTMALWPGSVASVQAYRDRFGKIRRSLLLLMVVVSLIGGILGANLLLNTSNETLSHLFPFLLLIAALVFTFGNSVATAIRTRLKQQNEGASVQRPAWIMFTAVAVVQLLISIYGGYFGGGIGIMMLAVLSVAGMEDIHAMNALKTLLASCINGVAVVPVITAGTILWAPASLMI